MPEPFVQDESINSVLTLVSVFDLAPELQTEAVPHRNLYASGFTVGHASVFLVVCGRRECSGWEGGVVQEGAQGVADANPTIETEHCQQSLLT